MAGRSWYGGTFGNCSQGFIWSSMAYGSLLGCMVYVYRVYVVNKEVWLWCFAASVFVLRFFARYKVRTLKNAVACLKTLPRPQQECATRQLATAGTWDKKFPLLQMVGKEAIPTDIIHIPNYGNGIYPRTCQLITQNLDCIKVVPLEEQLQDHHDWED